MSHRVTSLCSALLLLSLAAPVAAQQPAPTPAAAPAARPGDVGSIDSILTALYATISGPVGQPRQWQRFHSLMHPAARLIPSWCDSAGTCRLRIWTAAEYQQRADSLLTSVGFVEHELKRKTERYGAVAHAFSAYASYRNGETTPFARGINSIQLFWDGTRWWVMSIYWDSERRNNPLPADFQ